MVLENGHNPERNNGMGQSIGSGDEEFCTERRTGRKKIKIEYIKNNNKRQITFSKRYRGIMKKAYELSTLTGSEVLLLLTSEKGHIYSFVTKKFKSMVTSTEGKNLISKCLYCTDYTNFQYEEPAYGQNIRQAYESREDKKQEAFAGQDAEVSRSLPVLPKYKGEFGTQQYEDYGFPGEYGQHKYVQQYGTQGYGQEYAADYNREEYWNLTSVKEGLKKQYWEDNEKGKENFRGKFDDL